VMPIAAAPLYELANMRELLDGKLAETDGELTPELEQLLDALDGKIEEKIERVGLFVLEQSEEAEKVKKHEQRLAAKRKAHERVAEQLRHYLQRQMERLGKTKVDGLLCTVALQRNSAPTIEAAVDAKAVLAGPQGDLFAERVETVEYRLRRDAIVAAWKSQQPLPAGVSVTVGQHIRIR
jgi:hypothetical protein